MDNIYINADRGNTFIEYITTKDKFKSESSHGYKRESESGKKKQESESGKTNKQESESGKTNSEESESGQRNKELLLSQPVQLLPLMCIHCPQSFHLCPSSKVYQINFKIIVCAMFTN